MQNEHAMLGNITDKFLDRYVGDEYNFGLVRISHRDGNTVLRHEVIDAKQQVRYAREIVAVS